MDFEIIARQLVRAVRGRRSQLALSRRLGYRTNAVYKWEAGRDFPTAATFFGALARAGIDPIQVVERFAHGRPPWLEEAGPDSPRGVALWLQEQRGGTSILALARRTGFSRFAIGRWLQGDTEPRLHQFLALFEACSLRLLDLLHAMVDPAALPAVRAAWRHLEATRKAARHAPWTQALLRASELSAYQALPQHEPGWMAARIGISQEEEEAGLQLLADSGEIMWQREHWQPTHIAAVDMRSDPASTRAQRAFWCRQALTRLEAGAPGVFSYNVCGVSERDLKRLRDLHRSYYAEMRAIIAASEPVERVVVANMQLFALDPEAP